MITERKWFLRHLSPHVFCKLRLPLHRIVTHLARELSEILMHITMAFQGRRAGKALMAFRALECASRMDGAHVVLVLRVSVKGHVTLFALQTYIWLILKQHLDSTLMIIPLMMS